MGKLTKDSFGSTDQKKEIRINKYISDAGICSRREADRWIISGKVQIDGEIAVMGSKVTPGQKVTIEGQDVTKNKRMILIAFHKPVGIVCTADKREPDNIVDYIDYGARIFPIGRLDKDSEGLILLTNNGEIVNKILRAGNRHEKEYIVEVNKPITEEFLRGMAGGVPILNTRTKPCLVEQMDKTKFRIVLTQGLNRQIRRMCEYFDYRVRSLLRVRIMNITLGRLKAGTWRNLTERELLELEKLLKDSSNCPAAKNKTEGDKTMPLEGIVIQKNTEKKAEKKNTQKKAAKMTENKKVQNPSMGRSRSLGKSEGSGNKTGKKAIKNNNKNKDGAVWKKRKKG